MSKITYNTRLIFESEDDKRKILEMLEAARFAWNECSKVKFEKVPKNSIVDLHAAFYKEFRQKNPNIQAQIVITAQRELLSSFRSIKSNKQKIDSPPVKNKLSIQLDKRLYSRKGFSFKITSLTGRVSCKPYVYDRFQEYFEKYKSSDPLLFVRNGEVWISLCFYVPEILSPQSLAVGVDLGCRVAAATSEGNLYVDKKFNKDKRKLRYLKRQLNSKKSKGSKTAKRHLKKLQRKERNINHNFSHNLSKKIIQDTKADTIVVENLKSIKVKKDKFKTQNRISQVPLYQLRHLLTYKAPLAGKTVIEVCPSYTSQTDSVTQKRDGERRGRRYYSKSGKIYDADINAAVNIGLRSKLPVSLGSSNSIETYGQANVKSPIVGQCGLQAIVI